MDMTWRAIPHLNSRRKGCRLGSGGEASLDIFRHSDGERPVEMGRKDRTVAGSEGVSTLEA